MRHSAKFNTSSTLYVLLLWCVLAWKSDKIAKNCEICDFSSKNHRIMVAPGSQHHESSNFNEHSHRISWLSAFLPPITLQFQGIQKITMLWLSKYKKNAQAWNVTKSGSKCCLSCEEHVPNVLARPDLLLSYKNICCEKEIDSGTPNYPKMLCSREMKHVRWVLLWCQFGGDKSNIFSPNGGSKSSKDRSPLTVLF